MSSKKKLDKEDLKSPDVFVSTSDKVFNFIETHFKTVMAIFGGALVIGVVYVAVGYMQTAKEEKAAEALYTPEAELKKAETALLEAKAKKVEPPPAAGKVKGKAAKLEAPSETPAPVDYAKDYAPIVAKVKAQISGHADTKAAMISALNLSNFLVQQKQYPEALETLNLAKYQPAENDDLIGFWSMHRGLVLLENAQYDAAIDIYQKVLGRPALTPFYPEAILKQGLCFELKGDLVKARASYERLGKEFPRTEASTLAEQYLRLLDLKKQG